MKVTIVHTNNKKQLLVSNKTMEKLLERIAKDDSRLTVTQGDALGYELLPFQGVWGLYLSATRR